MIKIGKDSDDKMVEIVSEVKRIGEYVIIFTRVFDSGQMVTDADVAIVIEDVEERIFLPRSSTTHGFSVYTINEKNVIENLSGVYTLIFKSLFKKFKVTIFARVRDKTTKKVLLFENGRTREEKDPLDIIRTLKVFLGFNVNIDKIIYVDKRLEKVVNRNTRKAILQDLIKPRKKINSIEDVFVGIIDSMRYGSQEWVIEDPSVIKWLENLYRDNLGKETRIGGQAGIIANLIAILGGYPTVYSPVLSKEQAGLLHKNVFSLCPTRKPVTECADVKESKVNWVFEFNRTDKLFNIRSNQDGRFIAGSQMEEYRPEWPDINNIDVDAIILSGFHLLKKKYRDGTTAEKIIKETIEWIDGAAKRDIPTHLELTCMEDEWLREKIAEILYHVDSVGMNKDELRQIAELDEEKTDLPDALSIIKHMKKIAKKFGLKRVHVHTLGYYINLYKDSGWASPEKIKKAMLFASDLAAAKAFSGSIEKMEDLEIADSISLSKTGLKEQEKLEKEIGMENGVARVGDYTIIFLPTKVVGHPKTTVGLGDTISGSMFVVECGYRYM